jgi:hypothetical protein
LNFNAAPPRLATLRSAAHRYATLRLATQRNAAQRRLTMKFETTFVTMSANSIPAEDFKRLMEASAIIVGTHRFRPEKQDKSEEK